MFFCFFSFCRFYWAHSYTTPTSNALTSVDSRVIKPLFISKHRNRCCGTNRITGCATATVFFTRVKNWYIFHQQFTSLFIINAPSNKIYLKFHPLSYPVLHLLTERTMHIHLKSDVVTLIIYTNSQQLAFPPKFWNNTSNHVYLHFNFYFCNPLYANSTKSFLL